MLTNEETDAVCIQWHAKSARAKAATVKKADRLRTMAQTAPPFQCGQLETWRLGSQRLAQDISNEWNDAWMGAAPAIEVGILEKLFSSPRVKTWESAYRVIRAGLDDPHIAADENMSVLFGNLLMGIADTADYFSDVRYIVSNFLVDDEMQKAMLSQAGRINGRKPHINHAQAAQRLPGLWAEMREQGKSKAQAAPLIAGRLGLSSATVRKKLQGL